MRKWNARLELEPLERRDNPSGLSDLWDGITYYGGAAWDGVKEGATNIATGARDAVVELVRTGGDVITIYTTDTDKLDPSQLNSKLFQGAAATAGNPQAAAQFDNQLVFGIATLGVGPLVQSGVKATETGDWSEFSHQAGGFGVMVLVPYAGVKGLNALPPMPVRVPVFQPSAALVTADGMLVAVPGGVAWETVAVVSFAVPVEAATALGGTGAVFAVVANGPGGTEPATPEPNGAQGDAAPPTREGLLGELAEKGVKHAPDQVVAIARDANGKIVFLERGNARAGLQHILDQHAADFARRGIPVEQIPDAVMAAATRGKPVGVQGTRPVYEVEFNGQTHRVAVTVGDNGFVVGANPAK
jgi:hypothetical protein